MAFLDRLAIPRGFGRKVLGRPVRSGRRARFDEVVSIPAEGRRSSTLRGILKGATKACMNSHVRLLFGSQRKNSTLKICFAGPAPTRGQQQNPAPEYADSRFQAIKSTRNVKRERL
jgi:hypothetical protein